MNTERLFIKNFIHDECKVSIDNEDLSLIRPDIAYPENTIKTGDTFLVVGKSWIGKTIIKVMKRWGRKQGYDVDKIKIYSHAARFVWEGNMLWLSACVV